MFSRTSVAILIACLAGICTLLNFIVLDGNPYQGDGRQYATMAYNLRVHKVLSLSEDGAPQPTNVREPAYPVLLAGMMTLAGVDESTDLGCLANADPECGPLRRILKLPDLLLQSGIALLAAAVAWQLSGSALSAIVAVLLLGSSTALLGFTNVTSSEVLGATALLAHAACLLQIACGRGHVLLWGLGAGLALGILVLTKAAFVIYLLALVLLLPLVRWKLRRTLWPGLVAVVVAGLMTGGWMFRNYQQVGTAELAQRGPQVLALRAQYGDMGLREYVAGYVYATPLLGSRILIASSPLLTGNGTTGNRRPGSRLPRPGKPALPIVPIRTTSLVVLCLPISSICQSRLL